MVFIITQVVKGALEVASLKTAISMSDCTNMAKKADFRFTCKHTGKYVQVRSNIIII